MKRIIIADDSSLARMFTSRCISVSGYSNYEIIEAKDGLEVHALLSESSYDVVITDLNMPEMNGIELLKMIADNPQMNQTPIIVVTSAGNSEQREELFALGAVAILSKPITPPDIAAVIDPYLEKGDTFYV